MKIVEMDYDEGGIPGRGLTSEKKTDMPRERRAAGACAPREKLSPDSSDPKLLPTRIENK